ncbi:hypothetical protein ACH4FX_08250 [Streptomyces sp. NPDC018019]
MEWTDPRYEQVVADLRARQRAEAEEGRAPRALRGFIRPSPECEDEE